MKVKLLGIQSGAVEAGMTGEEYVAKQIAFMEGAVEAEKPDLVVFPEMMTGAYFGMVKDRRYFAAAEDFLNGPTTAKMLEVSKKLGIHLVYSLYEKALENGRTVYYNTAGLLSPTRGILGKYRKIHIPYGDVRYRPIAEKFYFSGGSEMPVFELDNGMRVAVMICYDRSFPEQWRNYSLKRVDLVCVPTCSAGARGEMFVTELQTRALESHTFVIAANRAGEERVEGEETPRSHYGASLIVNPLGRIVQARQAEAYAYVAAEIDLEELVYARNLFNFERDRRPELYGAVTDMQFAVKGWHHDQGF